MASTTTAMASSIIPPILGATMLSDSSENSPLLVCDDGVDNDGDGLIDFPADPGCTDFSDASENEAGLPCDDGLDNDADGLIDYPADPGCENTLGIEDPPCRDDIDNDARWFHRLSRADPGCDDAGWGIENPQCQDGINNDGQPGTDFDGGESVLGAGNGDPNGPDPQCVGQPWKNQEVRPRCRASPAPAAADVALAPPLTTLDNTHGHTETLRPTRGRGVSGSWCRWSVSGSTPAGPGASPHGYRGPRVPGLKSPWPEQRRPDRGVQGSPSAHHFDPPFSVSRQPWIQALSEPRAIRDRSRCEPPARGVCSSCRGCPRRHR